MPDKPNPFAMPSEQAQVRLLDDGLYQPVLPAQPAAPCDCPACLAGSTVRRAPVMVREVSTLGHFTGRYIALSPTVRRLLAAYLATQAVKDK